MTIKIGSKVQITSVLPGSFPEKKRTLGKTSTVLRMSRTGSNQFVNRQRWVLSDYPTIWFEESELTEAADSKEIIALRGEVKYWKERAEKAEAKVASVYKALY